MQINGDRFFNIQWGSDFETFADKGDQELSWTKYHSHFGSFMCIVCFIAKLREWYSKRFDKKVIEN